MVTLEELKKIACDNIDKNKEKIIALGESIFSEPELGYKEYKTAEKLKKALDEINISYESEIALTGIVAPLKGKESKIKLAIMGELDAIVAPEHRCADKSTGAAHSCGHNCMIGALLGVAYAFKGTGIMEYLSGDIVLMAVPAEEYVELEYRNNLKKEGKIHFLGGKQEFIRLGIMDDIDMMIMQHATPMDSNNIYGAANAGSNGFIGKLVKYIGKEAHSGGAPHLGINALNAATLGLTAVHMQRETFQDKDHIRVHPIITKGGDLVNVVPADVRIETYIRGTNIDAILDANEKVTRAFKAGGDAFGAKTEITDLPGYLPLGSNKGLMDIMYKNMVALWGDDKTFYEIPPSSGSTDAGDVSYIMPAIQSRIYGVEGVGHSSNYEITNKELSYVESAKCLATTAIDLLFAGAKDGIKIKEDFKPLMTKDEYLKTWGNL